MWSEPVPNAEYMGCSRATVACAAFGAACRWKPSGEHGRAPRPAGLRHWRTVLCWTGCSRRSAGSSESTPSHLVEASPQEDAFAAAWQAFRVDVGGRGMTMTDLEEIVASDGRCGWPRVVTYRTVDGRATSVRPGNGSSLSRSRPECLRAARPDRCGVQRRALWSSRPAH